ncbi:61e2be3b-70e2-447f-9275-88cc9fc78a7e [Thermothielavioides terrestris]|uniref:Queuine tRNA-ribosyltransferase accessory subunit 2 n=1 Tax=Thermothielavioides terrestris TaxID=2587410 RepID=A0A3S4C5K8_9PEZI|nr:61e2be3b-70e2-447f-9275-88cc9fc78a7e [Thermothielavioides terrestris]
MRFELLQTALRDGAAARLGRLAFTGRRAIDTPNFIGVTSRGALPHLTPDNVVRHLQTSGAFMALEDFIERPQQYSKRVPPIFQTPTNPKHSSRLHAFTAMPQSITTVLSARRLPAVQSPIGNTNNSVSIFTSTGFQVLTTKEYLSAVQCLSPDIAIPPSDLTYGPLAPNSKRALRMAERTDEISTFAPVLPVPYSIQWEYLSRLAEDYLPSSRLSGLAVYDPDLLPDLADYCTPLLPLPRLSLSNPPTPHHILRQIALGIDLFALPFINTLSDAGLALDFTFPPPPPPPPSSTTSSLTTTTTTTTTPRPLAIDLADPSNATSLAPLSPTCSCYACTSHHRAYVHHLLSAREMLGWTLLQIHNHAVVAAFFAGVRATLAGADSADAAAASNTTTTNTTTTTTTTAAAGSSPDPGESDGAAGAGAMSGAATTAFEQAVRQFALAYEAEFPEGVAQRPRARGYHYKSVGGGEGRRNKPAWSKLDDGGVGDGGAETPVNGGTGTPVNGSAETPVDGEGV